MAGTLTVSGMSQAPGKKSPKKKGSEAGGAEGAHGVPDSGGKAKPKK